MLRILKTLVSVLRKPLFGTTIIPRDASVDPALFPQDDYPVHCTKCHYNLHGLPDGKCPECGTEFERGKLLVKTHILPLNSVIYRDSSSRKLASRLNISGCVLLLLAFLGFGCLLLYIQTVATDPTLAVSNNIFNFILVSLMAFMLVVASGYLFFVIALILDVLSIPKGAWKRRRAIIDAIKHAEAGKE